MRRMPRMNWKTLDALIADSHAEPCGVKESPSETGAAAKSTVADPCATNAGDMEVPAQPASKSDAEQPSCLDASGDHGVVGGAGSQVGRTSAEVTSPACGSTGQTIPAVVASGDVPD